LVTNLCYQVRIARTGYANQPELIKKNNYRTSTRSLPQPPTMVLDTFPEDVLVQVLAYGSTRQLGRLLCVGKGVRECVSAVLLVLDTASALLFLRATHRYLQLACHAVVRVLQLPAFAESTEQALQCAVAWVGYSVARTPLLPSLVDALCLPLVSTLVLEALRALLVTGGMCTGVVDAALAIRRSPARQLELADLRHERSRLAERRTIAVAPQNMQLFDMNATDLSGLPVMSPGTAWAYSSATYGGLVIIVGGYRMPGDISFITDIVVCFDPQCIQRTYLPPLPRLCYYCSSVVLGTDLFVCGGIEPPGHGPSASHALGT
jgi:hypothetical protein